MNVICRCIFFFIRSATRSFVFFIPALTFSFRNHGYTTMAGIKNPASEKQQAQIPARNNNLSRNPS